ncbi:Uncharacterized protein involved in exopolysaccharide biosynthesis [Cribrihabitans marinus]|uniref:Uncharacterized protein involved in exopolysaccharide biosynthesis n=1 Tax=Cribrihabitans marinus TaxID=1227549 RepID=A0A1H6SL63_9RHOB|nr:DUF874 domain-containing protein [Cribrihabitans marinus]GGH23196.1 hypothetical protein GCM10010973_08940 [Cribrihabitans marinus]SEI68678.1 Uncharacterized protein involved in exopolysaccharide biosynthesis [Cribrihabitans marinus]
MGPIYSLEDFLDMVRRRIVLILGVIFLGGLASVGIALMQAHEYESSEVIQIVQPMIDDDLARTTVQGSSARRLQLIEQQLMARSTILGIMDKYGLYRNLPGLTTSQKIVLFRESVVIEGVAAAREGFSDDGTISVLTITARMATPELAQAIASELGERTIELSNRDRINVARETLAFFDARERALTDELVSLEDQIAAYRLENNIALPDSVEFRRDEIAAINSELLNIARERIRIERAMELATKTERPATAERMREDFREDLATLAAQSNLLSERKTELEAVIQTSPEIERQLGAYERQLALMQEELEQIAERRTAAELGFRLEAERQAERLTVLEEAALPDYPVTRSRKRLVLLGVVASTMLALGLAFLRELRNPVIRSAAQMERELGITPAVSVPVFDPKKEHRRAARAGSSASA